MSLPTKLARVCSDIADHCVEIADMFAPGAKVTVLVRNPSVESADVLVTNDTDPEILAAIKRLMETR